MHDSLTGEKWFASSESNVFRLSRTEPNSLYLIIIGINILEAERFLAAVNHF